MTDPAELPTLLDISAEIGWPDTDAEAATLARLHAAGLGDGALGRLGELAGWLAGVQGVCPPREPQRPRLVLFRTGGPDSHTGGGQTRASQTRGAGAAESTGPGFGDVAAVFADVAAVGVRILDPAAAVSSIAAPAAVTSATVSPAGVSPGAHTPAADTFAADTFAADPSADDPPADDPPDAARLTADAPAAVTPGAVTSRSNIPATDTLAADAPGPDGAAADAPAADIPALSTPAADTPAADAPLRAGNALSAEAVDAAIRAGARAADEEIDSGADLLLAATTGPVGPVADVVVSIMTLIEPVKVVGLNTMLSDSDWMTWVAGVRDARVRGLPHRHEVADLLATVGGLELAALTGFLLRAAARRTPVLLDGVSAAAAALLAREITPNVVRWWQAGAGSTRPAHALALEEFAGVPILDLELGLDDGIGAVLAVQLLRAAVRAVTDLTVAVADDAEAAEGPAVDEDAT